MPEDPELGHALDQLQIELVVDVVLDRDRQDTLVHERADGVLDQPLLVGELEIHEASLGERPYKPSPTWRKNQNELDHQAPIRATNSSPPATGSAHFGKRCMRTISTFVANAP